MTAPADPPFRPDYAVPPGETLRATLDERGMSQSDLARRTGLSPKHINQIIQGAAPISPDTSLALERVLGVPARFWNALEANHQARQARLRDDSVAEADAEWLAAVPTKELMRRGLIPSAATRAELREHVLAFFGVASRQAWETVWRSPEAAYRRSRVFEANPYAMASWLRIGELRATRVESAPFDRSAFEAALQSIRSAMKEPPEVFEPKLKALCADAGVVVVIVDEIKGSRVNGATRWLSPTRALIQLSLRYSWEDVFWFSFFHEAGHVLLHGKREVFVDDHGVRTAAEDEADAFARSVLIPPAFEEDMLRVRTPSQARTLAKRLGIPPGIVVGRAQHERLMAFNTGNADRRRFRLVEPEPDGVSPIG
jgi:HTH-type transcriptional regulator/antitoxin HigA